VNLRNTLLSCLIICFFTLCLYNCSHAGGWDQCKGCHNGNVAPDVKELKEKYNSADKFVQAAKKSDDPLMNPFRKNDKLLKEAASDIGLK
jgi:hypothetical protein